MLGEALEGERREALEIFTKVYLPTGPGPNDRGLSRKHILESIDGSLRRLGTDYVDLYQAHRYDHETPLEETMQAFADLVRAGQGALHRRLGVDGRADLRAATRWPTSCGVQLDLEPAAVLDAVAGASRPRSCPTSRGARIGQIVWSPIAQGVLTGKYLPGAGAARRARAPPTRRAAPNFVQRLDAATTC